MEWAVVAVVAVAVLFGATKLPEIARNMGRAQGEFKKGLKEGEQQAAADAAAKPADASKPAEAAKPAEPEKK